MSSEQTRVFHTVDVFTSEPFTGNPLAIVTNADGLSDAQMQCLAREFNLPETIFIQQADGASNTAKVRIFTPVNELPFAGHPTIGCAIFLAEQSNEQDSFAAEIRLEEVAGLVPVQVERSDGNIIAQLTAPVIPRPSEKVISKSAITLDAATAASAIGLQAQDISSTPMAHAGGPTFIFIPIASKSILATAQPVQPLCNQLTEAYGATGLYVYHLDQQQNEIHARMFAPAAGIPEDPATGSAAAILASQLNVDKQLKQGDNQFVLRQGYDMGRPSTMQLNMQLGDSDLESVKVSGSSTAISSGEIRLPV